MQPDTMQTKPTHDKNLIILMGVGAGILLLAALGLFLVQGLNGPGEVLVAVTKTGTLTSTTTQTPTATSTGTRRPTRTPVLMTDTPGPSETSAPANSPTVAAATTQPAASATQPPASTATASQPAATFTVTNTSPPPAATDTTSPDSTATRTPTVTPTSLAEPLVVTGTVLYQGTPIENVTITLELIVSAQETVILTTTSAADGAYKFESGYTNKEYSIVFALGSNPQLTPASNYVAWSWIEGILLGDIEAPDLEISSVLDGATFEQISPANGSSYSAEQISSETPLNFEWASYPQAEQYWVDIKLENDEDYFWSSIETLETNVDFDGDSNFAPYHKITPGTYWWAVGSLRVIPGFRILAYTHNWTLVITP
jgi:hypothetical protein